MGITLSLTPPMALTKLEGSLEGSTLDSPPQSAVGVFVVLVKLLSASPLCGLPLPPCVSSVVTFTAKQRRVDASVVRHCHSVVYGAV